MHEKEKKCGILAQDMLELQQKLLPGKGKQRKKALTAKEVGKHTDCSERGMQGTSQPDSADIGQTSTARSSAGSSSCRKRKEHEQPASITVRQVETTSRGRAVKAPHRPSA